MSEDLFSSDSDVDGDLMDRENVNSIGSQNEEEDAFNAVIQLIAPHLCNESKKDEARKRMRDLGVLNMSHIEMLTEADMLGLMTVIEFRLMMKKIRLECRKSNANTSERSVALPETYNLDVEKIIPLPLLTRLKEDSMLDRYSRKKALMLLADDIADNVKKVTESCLNRVGRALVEKFPHAFGCLHGDQGEKDEIIAGIVGTMRYHIQYVKKCRKRSSGVGDATPANRTFTVHMEYGLDPEKDLPSNLLAGETPDIQERKRNVMVEMHSSGNIDWQAVLKLMSETMVSQRRDINVPINLELLLERWPFIGKHLVLQNHFCALMDVEMDEVISRMSSVLPQLVKYFQYASSQTRRGSMKQAPEDLNNVLRRLRSLNGPGNTELIAVVLCIMVHCGIPQEEMFLCFEETTSFDEVQSSPRLPSNGKPIIAVLGKELLLNPRSFVIVDRQCISIYSVSVSKSILIAFMSYFIFKIAYDKTLAPVLEFLQRKIFKIENSGSSRIERKKIAKGWSHASPVLTGKYSQLMKTFAEFRSKYDYDD